jgi:hypothetical protein
MVFSDLYELVPERWSTPDVYEKDMLLLKAEN